MHGLHSDALLKDHLFIQSLEKEGQEWLRGESAIRAAQWGGQQELELLTWSTQREEGREEEEGGRRREGESKGSSKERLVGDYLPRDGTKSSTAKE